MNSKMGNKNSKRINERPSTETARESKHELVVAIDVGTYGSGFAHQHRIDFRKERSTIHIFKKWSNSSYKTTTSLLLKPDGSFDSFGSKARDTYYKFKTTEVENKPMNWKDYLFFENFKMCLYEDLIDDDLKVKADNGKTVPAIVVFTKTIEFLKNKFLENLVINGTLKNATKKNAPDHILWVITVPAIWGEPAKQLMCRAAVKAGISRENLTLALEPECAAICCSQLSPALLDIHDAHGGTERILKPDAIIMVVDIGGGTVDIAVMMINDNGTMKQVYKSGGSCNGGVRINTKILHELKFAFGEDVMREFCQTYGQDEKELHDAIEKEKRQWTEDEDFAITLSNNLADVWRSHNAGENLKDHLKKCNLKKGANFISLDKTKFKHLFDECVKDIYDYLERVMLDPFFKNHRVSALLVVGGFAESTYLVQQLRRRLPDKRIHVIRPEEPECSVMCGAVIYGYAEEIVSSRIMTKTYGVAMTTEFNINRHIEREKYIDENGEEMANNVFRKHIEVGRGIPAQEWIQGKEYFPHNDHQTAARIYIFQSDNENPEHTTEEGCAYIGHVDVDFPDRAEDKERKVNIEFYFAGTYIKVRAKTIRQTKILRISRD